MEPLVARAGRRSRFVISPMSSRLRRVTFIAWRCAPTAASGAGGTTPTVSSEWQVRSDNTLPWLSRLGGSPESYQLPRAAIIVLRLLRAVHSLAGGQMALANSGTDGRRTTDSRPVRSWIFY